MTVHGLKILNIYYEDVADGNKRFELRKNDRDFQVGDAVVLFEIDSDGLSTGNEYGLKIKYILKDCPEYGLQDGYCIFGW